MDYSHNVVLNGKRVGKRWRYPSSMDCAQCHKGDESESRGTLGFITPQLNRVVNGTNQLQSLFARGILSANPVAGKPNAHRWYGPTDTSAALEQRVSSYFASNCSHCHGNNVFHGQARQNFDYFSANTRITYQPDPETFEDPTGAWVGMPSMSGGNLAWLVQPGYPDSSVIVGKMKHRTDDYIFERIANRYRPSPLTTPTRWLWPWPWTCTPPSRPGWRHTSRSNPCKGRGGGGVHPLPPQGGQGQGGPVHIGRDEAHRTGCEGEQADHHEPMWKLPGPGSPEVGEAHHRRVGEGGVRPCLPPQAAHRIDGPFLSK